MSRMDNRMKRNAKSSAKKYISIMAIICTVVVLAVWWIEIFAGASMLLNGSRFSGIRYKDRLLCVELQKRTETCVLSQEDRKMIDCAVNIVAKQKLIYPQIDKIQVVIRNKNGYPFWNEVYGQKEKIDIYNPDLSKMSPPKSE